MCSTEIQLNKPNKFDNEVPFLDLSMPNGIVSYKNYDR